MKKILLLSLCVIAFTSISFAQDKKAYKSVVAEEKSSQPFQDGSLPAQKQNLFLGFGLGYWNNISIHGRYSYRILDQGFLPDINNSISLEGGLGSTYYGNIAAGTNVVGLTFVAVARWDLQYDPTWIFFGNVGLSYTAVINASTSDVRGGGFFPALGIGAMYNMQPEWALRADFSYQFLGAGIVYRF